MSGQAQLTTHTHRILQSDVPAVSINSSTSDSIHVTPAITTMDPSKEQTKLFVADDISTVVSSAIGSVLGNASFISDKTKDWSNSIIQSSLKGLQSLNRPYKYCLISTIMQKNGAGLVSAASVYWDPSKDGVCKVSWENETMHCVVAVFGVSTNVLDGAPDDLVFGDAAVAMEGATAVAET